MTAIYKVLANNVQSLSSDEQAQARSNIGANRTVFVDTNATLSYVNEIIQDGDVPVLGVSSGASAHFCNLSYIAAGVARFSAIIGNEAVEWSCVNSTWTRTARPIGNEWTSFTVDTTVTAMADQLFTVGDIAVGYYFDNNSSFRLAFKSLDGERDVFLATQLGVSGGGFQFTTAWLSSPFSFTNSQQWLRFKGYDVTGDTSLEFEVYFANGVSDTVCQYRVIP